VPGYANLTTGSAAIGPFVTEVAPSRHRAHVRAGWNRGARWAPNWPGCVVHKPSERRSR
jgi:hypothetical protein